MAINQSEQKLTDDQVLIVGGGPVGLILARVLSSHGVRSLLLERNQTTTSWPKMDLTNARSMELFRKIGLADGLRRQGVDPSIDSDVLISTGLGCDHILAKWDLPSVNKFQTHIRQTNDGSQPQEPGQRISQAIFERWLKVICDEDPLIDVRFGWKTESIIEGVDHASTTVVGPDGERTVFVSRYAIGCDGGSSQVRRSLGIPIEGGPVPVRATLVHFKSKDLTQLHKHGRFWHIFFMDHSGGLGGAIIAQDEIDTWTVHLFQPVDSEEDLSNVSSEDIVSRVLGGMYRPYPVAIDKVLVRSVWRPVIAVTQSWSGPNLRVFLAGDAAHQNIPTGGYGMNMGIADAFDLGWKLSSVIKGTGGPGLLQSYEQERKPVAERNVAHSGVHFHVHAGLKEILSCAGANPLQVDEDTEAGRMLRGQIDKHYREHDGENKDFGIEMGYRYRSSIILPDKLAPEPLWTPSRYTPTTWPGGRPPHVCLSDGTAIFDHFGHDWTLLSFAGDESRHQHLVDTAKDLAFPLKIVRLPHEALAKKLYERNLVLVRPDQHVAWRADSVEGAEEAKMILLTVTGRGSASL